MLVSPCCLTAADHIWGAVWARKWAAPFNPVTQPEGEQCLGFAFPSDQAWLVRWPCCHRQGEHVMG
jgi:hypothetical protein